MIELEIDFDFQDIFFLAWAGAFVPFAAISSICLWQRKHVQPIKARQPGLVTLTNVTLICYVSLLCVSRIFREDYPCLLTMWSGFLGSVFLSNLYLVRCFILFLNYNLTQRLLELKKENPISIEMYGRKPKSVRMSSLSTALSTPYNPNHPMNGAGANSSTNLIRKNRSSTITHVQESSQPEQWHVTKRFLSFRFLFSRVLIFTAVLMLAPAALTVLFPELRTHTGPNCPRMIPDLVLLGYGALYLLFFGAFAYELRTVYDNFHIKEELRAVGICGLCMIIVWAVFNTLLQDINEDIFPFSTVTLLLGILFILSVSTIWPLYKSLIGVPELRTVTPDDISTLGELLRTPEGFENFRDFLATEFSAENIYFWRDVELYRDKGKQFMAADDPEGLIKLLSKAQVIYAQYIARGAPNEVNIPGKILSDLSDNIKRQFREAAARPTTDPDDAESEIHAKERIEGLQAAMQLFDLAQDDIFKLMHTDSYERYRHSRTYKEFIENLRAAAHQLEALEEMNVV